VSHTYANENIGQPSVSVERAYGEKHDRQTIKQLSSVCSICLEKSVSLAMHSNVITEKFINYEMQLLILLMHGNCNCMVPGFLEVAQHQLI